MSSVHNISANVQSEESKRAFRDASAARRSTSHAGFQIAQKIHPQASVLAAESSLNKSSKFADFAQSSDFFNAAGHMHTTPRLFQGRPQAPSETPKRITYFATGSDDLYITWPYDAVESVSVTAFSVRGAPFPAQSHLVLYNPAMHDKDPTKVIEGVFSGPSRGVALILDAADGARSYSQPLEIYRANTGHSEHLNDTTLTVRNPDGSAPGLTSILLELEATFHQ